MTLLLMKMGNLLVKLKRRDTSYMMTSMSHSVKINCTCTINHASRLTINEIKNGGRKDDTHF